MVNRLTGKSVKILDCTIRDGSYLIDYQFTVEDAYLIASALCRAGIEYIEVGHGLGLDAQWRGKGLAAESDYAYIEASVAATQGHSKIGVFFIPGIGDIESIKRAANVGLDFVRVGTNVNEYTQAREAVEVAKRLGLKVWSNLMKSYIVPPAEFAQICQEVEKYGVDVIAMVDSAGGMTSNSVRQYVSAAKSVVNCALGFHGHNNLQLVIGNCLAAVECGCVFIDASLRGMGRSAGNAATEILCALLMREGVDIGTVNCRKLIRVADELVAPMMPRDRGLLPIEIACGLSHFHSSFLPVVERSSAEHGVAAFEVVLEINARTKTSIGKDLADKTAANVSRDCKISKPLPRYDSRWLKRLSCRTVEELISTLNVLSSKTGYQPILSLARSRKDKPLPIRLAPIRIGSGYCVGHIELGDNREFSNILEKSKQLIKCWMVDVRISLPMTDLNGLDIVRYDDELLMLLALCDFIRVNTPGNRVYIRSCSDPIIERTKQLLKPFVNFCDSGADVGIALSNKCKLKCDDIDCICSGGLLVIAQMDSVEDSAFERAYQRELSLHRLDLGDALICEVARVFNTQKRVKQHAGRIAVAGQMVVAGGAIGKKGEIVVDSVIAPTLILGKADGCGGIDSLDDSDEVRRGQVLGWILSTYSSM